MIQSQIERVTLYYPDIIQEMTPQEQPQSQQTQQIIEPIVEEKKNFNLTLVSFDATLKLQLIKFVKEKLGLGLKESKDLVEKTPSQIKQSVPKEEAQLLVEEFLKVGGKIEMDQNQQKYNENKSKYQQFQSQGIMFSSKKIKLDSNWSFYWRDINMGLQQLISDLRIQRRFLMYLICQFSSFIKLLSMWK